MESDKANVGEYFASYSDLHVHELMLKDRPRVVAYRRFFEENQQFVKGKVVMDVGAGTGILSLFAASAGAKKVYAVEASSVASLCKEVVEENNFESVIEVIHEKVENVKLPEGIKVDIIVSEWMGFYLLHESMLDSIIVARDKFLAPLGILAPSRACLYVAPLDMSKHFEERAEYWSNIHSFDFSPIASALNMAEMFQPVIMCVDQHCVKHREVKLLDLDLKTVKVEDVKSFRRTAEFTFDKEAFITGFGFWFDVHFDIESETKLNLTSSKDFDDKKSCSTVSPEVLNSINHIGDDKHGEKVNSVEVVRTKNACAEPFSSSSHINSISSKSKDQSSKPSLLLSTSPYALPTHWKQTIMLLPQTILVMEETSVCCKIDMIQDTYNKRHYKITLEMDDKNNSPQQEIKTDSDENYDDDVEESDDSTGHPTPCHCGSNRCRLIAALMDKYDAELQELEDEAENVETKAEVEAATEIDALIEHEGWPMDSSNVEGGEIE